jgi:hypothetical protein
MKKPKQKISIVIEEDKVTLTMEGEVPTILAESIPDLIASALTKTKHSKETPTEQPLKLMDAESWTVREKVRYVVLRHCRHGWFTSKDVRELYDRTFHPPIAMATTSTYLSRMFQDGSLARRGSVAKREYRVNVEELADEIAALLATKT